jgi:hypothetical protein
LFENDLHRRIAGTTTMRAFLPAIALCAVLQAGAAAQPARQAAPAAAAGKPAEGVLQAKLAATGDAVAVAQRGTEAGTGKAGVSTTASHRQDAGEEHRPTTAAMLLAALILMTGIALRRWGVGDQ